LLKDMTGRWSSGFLLLCAIVVISLIGMYLSVKQLSRQGHSAPVAAT
ncbi:MFS transporter, partial [Rhizobium ruizarguesonis]